MSSYKSGDKVLLKPGASRESKTYQVVILIDLIEPWLPEKRAWRTNKELSGIFESEIERRLTDEEYEKYQLQQALK